MIKDNQKYFNRLQVFLDALVVAGSYLLAWAIQFYFLADPDSGKLPVSTYMTALLFIVPGYLILYDAFHLYTPKRVQGRRLEASNLFFANMVGLLVFMFLLYLINEPDFSRRLIFMFTGICFIATVLERNTIRLVLRDIRSRGMNQKHMLLVHPP